MSATNCPHPLGMIRDSETFPGKYCICEACLYSFNTANLAQHAKDEKGVGRLIRALAGLGGGDDTPLGVLFNLEAAERQNEASLGANQPDEDGDGEKAWGHEHRTRPAPKLT